MDTLRANVSAFIYTSAANPRKSSSRFNRASGMCIEPLENRVSFAVNPFTPDQIRRAYGVDQIQFGSAE
jgi:hypothetical protein